MNPDPLPRVNLPTDLTDETVAELLKLLYALTQSLERVYDHQLRRHHVGDDNQPSLWDDLEPPF